MIRILPAQNMNLRSLSAPVWMGIKLQYRETKKKKFGIGLMLKN